MFSLSGATSRRGAGRRLHPALRVLRTLALVGVLLGAATVALEDYFIYFPSRTLYGTPAERGLRYVEASFTTADGVRLHGWFIPGRSGLTWFWLHGNAGNISHRLENIELLHHRLGVSVFIFDYRGYGRSEGRPSEQGTYRDAEAALAYVRGLPSVDPSRIVVFGRSLGAAVAVELATHERVLGLILESPFSSIPAMARAVYPWLPVGPLLRTRYDSLGKIGRIEVPLLILHSPGDEVVPYQQGRDLFAAAREPKRFHAIEGAGHNDTYIVGGEPYWQALADFLATLGPAPHP